MGVSAGWTNEMFAEINKFGDWKKQFPQYNNFALSDWVAAGAPSNGQLPGGFQATHQYENSSFYPSNWGHAPTSTSEQNIFDWWQRVDPSRGGIEADSPGGKEMTAKADETKKRLLSEGSSAERLRGRESTYMTAGSLLTEPNLFKGSLL